MTVEVKGLKRTKRKLETAGMKITRKILRRSMRESGKQVQRVAQSIVPVRTGDLRRSIRVRALPRSRVRFGIRVFTDGSVGDVARYASKVEFGDPRRNHSPAAFMRKAGDRELPPSKRRIAKDLKQSLKEL